MTSEEAIKELQIIADEQFVADRAEAIYMAIDALKHQMTGKWLTMQVETIVGAREIEQLKTFHSHTCSSCGYETGELPRLEQWKYCPNCGVKMESVD